jgi:hypothetical protein
MVEEVWLDEGDMIVPELFVNEHIDGKCISTQKVKEAIKKILSIPKPDKVDEQYWTGYALSLSLLQEELFEPKDI